MKCSLDMSLFYRKTRGLVNRSVHKTPTFIIEPDFIPFLNGFFHSLCLKQFIDLCTETCLVLLGHHFTNILGEVELAPLPCRFKDFLLQGSLNATVCVRGHKQRAIQASLLETIQEVPPAIGGLFRIYVEPQNLTVAIAVATVGYHESFGDDAVGLAHLEVGSISGKDTGR